MQPLVSPKQSQEGLRFYRGRGGDQANATGRRDVAIVTGGTAGIGEPVSQVCFGFQALVFSPSHPSL